ncbi:MAG TPA: tryptophan-rich sensory protein [Methanotrichaceae archaeon]|nr:tryptophan-rich sensory protein [Methanotrichaceae archaeon]HQF16896.1 tryptophan-rich sensory protein [Methanotrichaceae archaeon]HQI91462.1 tryptophan-rich sensory protein [Methanotrichaceae archaeon]HQJ28759.1 tryptophan-rich sensory protein [Methanotrichaceae archaeon]
MSRGLPPSSDLRSPALAMAAIVILWVLIVHTILRFWEVSRPAASLLLTYLLWVTFAAYLNFSIWQLN